MAIDLLRLVVDQMKVGQPLPFGVRDESGKLLLARGSVITGAAQLQTLIERGLYVELPDAVTDVAAAATDHPPTLFDLWKQCTARLDRLIGSLHQPGFPERCDAFAGLFMQLVARDPDIGIYQSVRQDPNRLSLYGLSHALHCAMLGQLAATRVGWPAPRVRTLVKAALTMNLAIVELQGQFAMIGRLDDFQRSVIRGHPQAAVDKLQAAGVTDADWLQAVLEHHERPGGGGYPQNLAGVCEIATVLRMLDVFMAKISPRVERPPLSVVEAARQLYADAPGHPMAAAIIKEYGLYPPGSFVQLASGEIAVVIRRGTTAHTPMAGAITDRNGIPVVRTTRRETADPAFAIKGLVAASRTMLRMPPERLYGLAA